MSDPSTPPPPPESTGGSGDQTPPPPPPQASSDYYGTPSSGATGTPPPVDPAGAAPASPGPSTGLTGDQVKESLQSAHRVDLAIVGLGVLLFILSMFPYYKVSVDIAGFSNSGTVSAWHGFFGWFGALVALVVAVIVALHLLGIKLPFPVRLATVGGFGVSAVCIFLALFIIPGGDCQGLQACEDALDFGHGFGYWLSVVVVIGALVLAVTRMTADDESKS